MWGPPGGPDPASGGPSNEWTGPPIPGGPSNEWTAPPLASGGPSNEWTGPGGPSNEWTAPPPASGGPSNEWSGPSIPGGPSNEWTAPPQASGGPSNEWTGPPIPASGGSVYGAQPPYGFRPTAFPPAPHPRLEGYGPGPPPPHMAGHGYGFDPSVPPPSFNRPPPPPQHGPPFPPMLNQAQRSLHGGPPCSDLRPPPLAGPPPPSSSGPWFEDVHNNNPGASTSSQRFHQQQRQAESCGFGPQGVQSLPSSDSLRQHAHRDVPERGGGGPLLDSPAFPPAAAAWSRGDVQNQSFVKAPETQPPPDEDAVQRRQDEQWLRRFLQSRWRAFKMPASEEEEEQEEEEGEQPSRSSNEVSVPLMQSVLYGAARLVSELSLACETLRRNLENEDESVWADSYAAALRLKGELRDRMTEVSDDSGGRRLDALKSKLSRVAKKRAWQRRKKLRQREEKRLEEERVAEKEAEIDKWRLKKILEVEEKKREQELKLATDSVLSEVLKKQADVKRMLDILRSLEKLRKLRKEAASRKGIFPEPEADQVFDQQLEQLRALIRKRTAVYGAEENMLRVMLEGEQEEERKKDLERRQRKERERHLQKKRDMEAMLFGDEMPADHLLQPFREYYTQAEHSLPALVQIRREWDVFLVAVDHPDGTPIPQGWVLPEAPSDWAWGSALEQ